MARINGGIDKEIQDAIKTLRKLPAAMRGEARKSILKKAAIPLQNAAVAAAPRSKKPHRRKKGGLSIVYFPGNLKGSIQILNFRKSQDVFVGAKISKKSQSAAAYGRGRRVDGYYAHMVEFGTRNYTARPFMRPAADATRKIVNEQIKKGITRLVNNYISKNRK